jgi:hypothetical protein
MLSQHLQLLLSLLLLLLLLLLLEACGPFADTAGAGEFFSDSHGVTF